MSSNHNLGWKQYCTLIGRAIDHPRYLLGQGTINPLTVGLSCTWSIAEWVQSPSSLTDDRGIDSSISGLTLPFPTNFSGYRLSLPLPFCYRQRPARQGDRYSSRRQSDHRELSVFNGLLWSIKKSSPSCDRCTLSVAIRTESTVRLTSITVRLRPTSVCVSRRLCYNKREIFWMKFKTKLTYYDLAGSVATQHFDVRLNRLSVAVPIALSV